MDANARPLADGRWRPAPDPAPTPRWLAIALPAAAALVFLVACVALSRRPWYPTIDDATMELNVRDVGSRTPLVGPYSRYGWFHPGPILYLLLAIPYRLLGSHSIDLAIGAAAINGLSLAGIVAVALRRGGLALTGLALGLTALLAAAMGSTLVDPWGPYVTVLPLVLLVLVAWSASCGDSHWCLPVGVLLATFLVQTHVGYSAVALVLAGWIAAWWVVDLRAATGSRRVAYAGAAVAVAGVALLWSPVVGQELTHEPGNLSTIWDYFSTPGQPRAGPATGWSLVARQLTLPAPWLGASEAVSSPLSAFLAPRAGGFPFALVVFVAAGAAAAARRHPVWRLDAVVALCLLAGCFAMASIQGPLVAYLVRWTWALGMLVWLAAGWTGWCLVVAHLPARAPMTARVAGGVVAIVALASLAATVVDARPTLDDAHEPSPRLARAIIRRFDATDRPLYVRAEGTNLAGEGLLLQLERAGRTVVASPFPPDKFGAHRRYRRQQDVVPLFVALGGGGRPDRVERLQDDTGWELVAEADPIGPAGRRRLDRALDTLAESPGDAAAQRVVDRYWGRPVEHVGVFLLPSADTPIPLPRAEARPSCCPAGGAPGPTGAGGSG